MSRQGVSASGGPEAKGSSSLADDLVNIGAAEAYEHEIPPWRPRLHPGSASLGYPDIFPPEPDRPNDITEQTLRAGITSRPVVGNETFSAHDMIYDRLRSGQALDSLGTFLEEMIQRRDEIQRFRIGPHLHKAPPRVTLTELKLNAYVRDLADPSVPLARLARSVPHGYRGERLLEMLWQGGPVPLATAPNAAAQAAKPPAGPPKPVTMSRAMWFIRTVGCGEISSARNRSTASYTAEWTTALCTWLRKQLAELNFGTAGAGGSSSAAPGSPATPLGRSTGGQSKGGSASTPGAVPVEPPVLATEEARKRWGLKWAWSLRLVRQMTTQSLLDMRLFSRWVVDVLAAASLTQLPTTLALAHEFSHFILEDHRVLRCLAEGLCAKLTEMGKLPASKPVRRIAAQLVALLQYAFEVAPDAFVSSALWTAHGLALKEALLSTAPYAEGSKRAEQRAFDVAQLEARNRRLMSLGTVEEDGEEPFEVRKVKILDDIGVQTSTSAALDFFLRASKAKPAGFSEAVDDILLWGSTNWRGGQHRPFAAAQLLALLAKALLRQASAAHRAGARSLDLDLDAAVFTWLSGVEEAQSRLARAPAPASSSADPDETRTHVLASVHFPDLLILLGELIRLGALSFPKFLQRLTARGLTATTSQRLVGVNGSKGPDTSDGLRSKVLRSVPLRSSGGASAAAVASGSGANTLLGQRRIAIYGHRQKESYEEATRRRATRELRQHLGFLYEEAGEGGKERENESSTPKTAAEVSKHLPHFWMGSRYVRLSIIESEILPVAKTVGLKLGAARLAVVLHLITGAEDFASLAELLLSLSSSLLRDSTDASTWELIHASIARFVPIWRSMNLTQALTERLDGLRDAAEQRGHANQATISRRALLAWQDDGEATSAPQDVEEPPKSASAEEDKRDAVLDEPTQLSPELNGNGHGNGSAKKDDPVVAVLLEALYKASSVAGRVDADALALSVRTACSTQQDQDAVDAAFKQWATTWIGSETQPAERAASEAADQNIVALMLNLVLRGVLDLAAVLDSLILASARQAVKDVISSGTSDPNEQRTSRHLNLSVKLASLFFGVEELPTETPLLDGQLLDAKASSTLGLRRWQHAVVELLTLWAVCLQPTTQLDAATATDVRHNLTALSSDARIRSFVALRYRETCSNVKAICRAMWGVDVDAVLSSLLLALNPHSMLGAPALDTDCAVVIRHLNPWQAMVTTVELAIIVERLLAVESGLQARAHLVLVNLARSVLAPLFLENRATYGKALLAELHGQDFASRVVDCGFERLAVALNAGKDEGQDSQLVVRALVAVAESSKRGQLPSSSAEPIGTLCNAVIQGLETLLAQYQEAVRRSDGEHDAAEEMLDVGLLERVLQAHSLILRTTGVWTALSRPTAAKLLSHVAELALRVAQATDERSGQLLDLLLDLSAAAMDEAPSDTAALVVGAVSKALGSPDAPVTDGAAPPAPGGGLEIPTDVVARLRRIFGAGPTQQRSSRIEDMILARSARAAIEQCSYQPAPDKPWELHDSTEACLSGVPTQLGPNSAVAKEAAAKEARLGYALTPIQDVGSLSLSLFGVVKTFDRVPTASVDAAPTTKAQERLMGWKKHESERSYGFGVGGEPIYSRDARKVKTTPITAGGEPKRIALPLALQRADEILERAKRREEEEREEDERRQAAHRAAQAAAKVAAQSAAAAAAAAGASIGVTSNGNGKASGTRTTATATASAGKKRKADAAPGTGAATAAEKRKKAAATTAAGGRKGGTTKK